MAPQQNPSEFLLEIKRDYKNVVLNGEWNEEEIKQMTQRKMCPICGYPMQYRYKNAYGLRLHICTNDSELCGFMTNDYRAGKLSIMKCDKCKDGYLVVKPANGSFFLGCTNYKQDKTGCNNVISADEYYTLMKFERADIVDNIQENKIKNEKTIDASFIKTKEANEEREALSQTAKGDTQIKIVPKNDNLIFPEYKVKKSSINEIEYKGYVLNTVVKDVLSCLEHISERNFYGITVLITVLRGGDRKTLHRDNLKKVAEYGFYKDMKRNDMRAIVQWLMDNHFIHRTKERYPKVHLTYEAEHYEESITIGKIKKLKTYLEDPNRELFEVEEEDD